MTTAIFTHPFCLEHDPGHDHPESPDRLRAILDALAAPEFTGLQWREAPAAATADLLRVHTRSHVERIHRVAPQTGRYRIDSDTVLSPATEAAALRAAGAVCAAVDAVVGGEVDNAFCPVRPPGHHAEPDRAMGFCVFNNVAIGARRAREVHGVERVAVVDFDVHHGNGTQHAFETDPTLFYASTHQFPHYPGTGAESERGVCNIVNKPLPAFSEPEAFRQAYESAILPALDAFRPGLILVSAGFDAHLRDPLAQLKLTEADFAWVTRKLLECARRHAGGRLVSSLEGGYDPDALAASAAAHIRVLIEG